MKLTRLTASGASALQVWQVEASAGWLERAFGALPEIGALRWMPLRDEHGHAFDEVVARRRTESILELSLHGGAGVADALRAHLRAIERDLQEEKRAPSDFLQARSPLAAHWLWATPSHQADQTWRELREQDSQAAERFAEAAFRFHDWWKLATGRARFVLAGAPNAGKSSLMNAWLMHDRVTVSPYPGTTRDAVEAQVLFGPPELAGELRLVDTAGLWRQASGNDAAAVQQSREVLAQAWRVLWVIDRSQPIPSEVAHYLGRARSCDYVIGTHADRLQADTDLAESPAQFLGDFDLQQSAAAAVLACTTALRDQLGEPPQDFADLPWLADTWQEMQQATRRSGRC